MYRVDFFLLKGLCFLHYWSLAAGQVKRRGEVHPLSLDALIACWGACPSSGLACAAYAQPLDGVLRSRSLQSHCFISSIAAIITRSARLDASSKRYASTINGAMSCANICMMSGSGTVCYPHSISVKPFAQGHILCDYPVLKCGPHFWPNSYKRTVGKAHGYPFYYDLSKLNTA